MLTVKNMDSISAQTTHFSPNKEENILPNNDSFYVFASKSPLAFQIERTLNKILKERAENTEGSVKVHF